MIGRDIPVTDGPGGCRLHHTNAAMGRHRYLFRFRYNRIVGCHCDFYFTLICWDRGDETPLYLYYERPGGDTAEKKNTTRARYRTILQRKFYIRPTNK